MSTLTVVVPTAGRLANLRVVLASLEQQTLPRPEYEILVVDDGSVDLTERWCSGWQDGGLRRYVRQNRCGTPLARNLGALMAWSPLVLFLDDDQRARPELLEEHGRAHGARGDMATVVVGSSTWEPAVHPSALMRYLSTVEPLPLTYPSNPRLLTPSIDHFRTHQLSFKRSFLVRRGLHDARFDLLADLELACRLAVHGLRVRYCSHARSERLTTFTFAEWCEQLRRAGAAAAVVGAAHDHPVVRRLVRPAAAAAEWRASRASYDDWCRTTGELDAALGQDHDGRSDDELLLLWRGYRRCFAASWARGVVEGDR